MVQVRNFDEATEAELRLEAKKATERLLVRLTKYHSPDDVKTVRDPDKVERKVVREIKEEAKLLPAEVVIRPRVMDIKRAVVKYFQVDEVDLDAPRKFSDINYARQVCMYLARQLTLSSFPEIGRRLGGRDHTTILYGSNKIKKLVREDWRVAYDVAQVEAMI